MTKVTPEVLEAFKKKFHEQKPGTVSYDEALAAAIGSAFEELSRPILTNIRAAIVGADPAVLTDVLWMPDDILMGATVVDYIDIALSGYSAPGQEEGL